MKVLRNLLSDNKCSMPSNLQSKEEHVLYSAVMGKKFGLHRKMSERPCKVTISAVAIMIIYNLMKVMAVVSLHYPKYNVRSYY